MARRLVLTEQERDLIALWRAFRAYDDARSTALEEPGDVWIEVLADGSGRLVVDPADPNQPHHHPAAWHELHEAPARVTRGRKIAKHRRRHMRAVNRARNVAAANSSE